MNKKTLLLLTLAGSLFFVCGSAHAASITINIGHPAPAHIIVSKPVPVVYRPAFPPPVYRAHSPGPPPRLAKGHRPAPPQARHRGAANYLHKW